MTSVIRNRSKSRSKKTRESIDTDDKIDQIMKDITLRRPRNPYTQFVLAEVGSFRTKNKEAKIDLQEFNQTCAEKWKKMKEGDKKKYLKQYVLDSFIQITERRFIKSVKCYALGYLQPFLSCH